MLIGILNKMHGVMILTMPRTKIIHISGFGGDLVIDFPGGRGLPDIGFQ